FAFESPSAPGSPIPSSVLDAITGVSGQAATLLDVCVVAVGGDGTSQVLEYSTLRESHGMPELELRAVGLQTEEDALELASGLLPGWSALVVAFEQTWLRGIAGAVEAESGRVLADVRIPAAVVNEIAELAAAAE